MKFQTERCLAWSRLHNGAGIASNYAAFAVPGVGLQLRASVCAEDNQAPPKTEQSVEGPCVDVAVVSTRLPAFNGCAERSRSKQFQVSRSTLISEPGELPPGVDRVVRGFEIRRMFDVPEDRRMLWVRGQQSRMWWPYSIDDRHAEILAGGLLPAIDEVGIETLREVDYLCADDDSLSYQHTFSVTKFHRLLNSLQCAAICEHFRALIRNAWIRKGDLQTPHRWWAHNDAISRYLHASLTDVVREATGVDWQPTFTSFLGYEFPGDLRSHVDRDQAALTVSILIGYFVNGEPSHDQWPILVETAIGSGEFVTCVVGVGNAIAFRGDTLRHKRSQIQPGHEAWCICLHFAEPHFEGKRL